MDGEASVLLIDPAGPAALEPVLERCGFMVIWSATPEGALFELSQHHFAAVIAALPLPGLGISGLCQELGLRGHIPVLAVSSAGIVAPADALGAGAADHLRIPCDERELRARLLALIRRMSGPLSARRIVIIGELVVRLGRGVLAVDPALALTPVQATVLGYLAAQQGVVVSGAALAVRVRTVHGAISDDQFDAELRGLQAAVAAASGIVDALDEIDGIGWRLVRSGD